MPAETEWRRGRLYDWPAMAAHLRKRPGAWELMLRDVPRRLAQHVRLKRSPELRFPGDQLEARIANEYTTADGQHRCDLFLRIVPTPVEGVTSDQPKESHD